MQIATHKLVLLMVLSAAKRTVANMGKPASDWYHHQGHLFGIAKYVCGLSLQIGCVGVTAGQADFEQGLL